ncbi:MAG: HNH endonuclease [Bacteroidales bacterium]|jgi:hypothetical protein|nr:HNH endonuclease [Bacteroidales bacterium]
MKIKEFKIIVNESKSFSEVSKKIYNNNYCGNRQTIKKRINEYDIDISHFDFKPKNNYNGKLSLNEIFVTGSTYNTKNMKKRLYNEGLKERKCEKCGQDEFWNGEKISLILDHINGDNTDNRIENLRIVCPNCNATLPTHGGKNIKFKSNSERKKYHNKLNDEEKEVSLKKRLVNQRKVKRPPYKDLLIEINELGYCGTGRKYGVSDNAIRKWKKFYENYK